MTDLHFALECLALPGAGLVFRDYTKDFGIAFWTIEDIDNSTNCDDEMAAELKGRGYVKMVTCANDKYIYELSDAGKQALAAAEGEDAE